MTMNVIQASQLNLGYNRQTIVKEFNLASMDLRLGPVAYRVRASFLPGENATGQVSHEK